MLCDHSFSDPLLSFNHEHHLYTYDGLPVESVTKVISSYSQEFDAEHWSQYVANKPGETRTPEEIRRDWEVKGDSAKHNGHEVHAEMERVANMVHHCSMFSFDPVGHRPEVANKMWSVWKWWADHIEVFRGSNFAEVKLVWPEYGLAGTCDLIATNYNGVSAVIDWKQNERIALMGKYRNLLPPFQRGKLKLPDLPFWKYCLQLNLYRRMLVDRYRFDIERMVMVHLKDDRTYEEYPVPVLDKHVDKILEGRV